MGEGLGFSVQADAEEPGTPEASLWLDLQAGLKVLHTFILKGVSQVSLFFFLVNIF